MPKNRKGDTPKGKMPVPVQLPSGNWRCRVSYTDEDGVTHKESFTEKTFMLSQAKALAWKAGIIKELELKKDLTLDQAITEYIESLTSRKASPATIRDYESRRKNSYPMIINKRLSRLSLLDVQRQLDARARTVSPKSVKNDYALLSAILTLYREDLNLKKIKLPERDDVEMVIPDDDQVRILMEAAKPDKDLYCAVLLAATAGLRRSEICALTWSDLDTETGALNISKALVKNEFNDWILKGPKKKSSERVISIEPEVIAELQKNRTGFKSIVNLNPDQVTNRFCHLRDALGMDEIRFHNLRHYKASVMLCLGIPLEVARRILGHRTDNMIKRVYGHLVSGAKTEVQERIQNHTVALLNGEKIVYLPQALPRAVEK